MKPATSIFRKTLRDVRWQIVWYGGGFALMAALVVFLYPSYSSQMKGMELPDAVKALMGGADYTSPRGFIGAEIFSWGPAVLAVFGIMAGTSLLAGEEANGTLDLLLSQPISRTTLMLAKLAGVFVACIGICALISVGWLLSVPFVGMDISMADLLLATFNLTLTMTFFAAFSAWAGAYLASRGMATGLAVALAVASFFVSYIAELVDAVQPLRYASVFHYNGGATSITEGIDVAGAAVLVGLMLLFTALGLRAFNARDLSSRTGAPLLGMIRSRFHRLPQEAAS
jgi:ABC-2 type transport system permease protein